MTADHPSGPRLRRPTADEIPVITGWPTTAEETSRWGAGEVHPVPADKMQSWWHDPEIEPWVLVDADDTPLAYGELWLDPGEDEVELARLIVDPAVRGKGNGRRLVQALTRQASTTGLATTFLRVVPDNTVAIGCYRSSGYRQLGAAEAAEWNEGQRREYVWMLAPA